MMSDVGADVPGVVGKKSKFSKDMIKVKDSVSETELVSLLEQEGLEYTQDVLSGCNVVDVVLPYDDAYLSFIYNEGGELLDVVASHGEVNFGVLSLDVDFGGELGLLHKLATIEGEAFVNVLTELGFVTLEERGTVTLVDETPAESGAAEVETDVVLSDEVDGVPDIPEVAEAFAKGYSDFVEDWLTAREQDSPKTELYDAIESVVSMYSLDGELYNSSEAGEESFAELEQVAPDAFKVVLEELRRAAEAGDVSAYEGLLVDLMVQAMDYQIGGEVADSAEGNALHLDSGVVIAMPGYIRYEAKNAVPYVAGHSFGSEPILLVTPEAKAAKVFQTMEEAQAYVDEHASERDKKYVKYLDFNDGASSEVTDSDAPRRDFIFPADSTMVNDGKGHFPINTLSRGRYALSAVAKYDKLPEWYAGDMDLEEFKAHVRSEVSKAFPSIEVSDSVKVSDGQDDPRLPVLQKQYDKALAEMDAAKKEYDDAYARLMDFIGQGSFDSSSPEFKEVRSNADAAYDKYHDATAKFWRIKGVIQFIKLGSDAKEIDAWIAENPLEEVTDAAPEFKVGDKVRLDTAEAEKRSPDRYYGKEGVVTFVSDFVLGVELDGVEVPVPTNFATLA